MISVEDAREKILEHFVTLDSKSVHILDSMGLVVSESIKSPLNIPPFNNSAMDGYAVISEDTKLASSDHVVNLKILETIKAGSVPSEKVIKGTASRIMTGAPIPEGADSIVPFEDTTELDWNINSDKSFVGIKYPGNVGANFRESGKDLSIGDVVVENFSILTPSLIGLLASVGLEQVKVIRPPVVSILSTGDELVEPGLSIEPGQIFDSNTYSIYSSVLQLGAIPKIIGIARDNRQSVIDMIEKSLNSDFVISSAGVSKGDYDVVKDVMGEMGNLNFWSVNMRPAKPLAFGKLKTHKSFVPIIGLPGNPVSSLVAFEQFCRPAIRKMMGKTINDRKIIRAKLVDSIENYDSRRVYARVIVESKNGVNVATTTGDQGSNILTSMAKANGLAICPENIERVLPGEEVDVILLDDSVDLS
tara:strand:- start:9177 stop:10430 length:1254 start_codon:yes stop_codon:yes gene_type:complete